MRRVTEDRVYFPPYAICKLCTNRLSDVCMERCAPAGDLQCFKPKAFDLFDLPKFSPEEFAQMPPLARQFVVAIYLSKIVEYLQGGVVAPEGLISRYVEHSGGS